MIFCKQAIFYTIELMLNRWCDVSKVKSFDFKELVLLEGFLKCLSTDCFALTHKRNELNPKPDSVVHVDDPFVRSFVSEASLPDTPGSCFSQTSPPGSCYSQKFALDAGHIRRLAT